MPIANCLISPDCKQGTGDLIEFWSAESGISSDQMTVNLLNRFAQYGNQYKIMANLLLPSMWSKINIEILQYSLAKALSRFFDLPVQEVHVVTSIVESGMVVEGGNIICW